MPNSQNRSNDNSRSGKGITGDRNDEASRSSKPNPERSDVKHGEHDKNHRGDTGRSSNQGRKEASGGEVD